MYIGSNAVFFLSNHTLQARTSCGLLLLWELVSLAAQVLKSASGDGHCPWMVVIAALLATHPLLRREAATQKR